MKSIKKSPLNINTNNNTVNNNNGINIIPSYQSRWIVFQLTFVSYLSSHFAR